MTLLEQSLKKAFLAVGLRQQPFDPTRVFVKSPEILSSRASLKQGHFLCPYPESVCTQTD